MDGKWDLSYLYQSFDDEQFHADLARLPEMIKEQKAIVENTSLTDLAKLEQLVDSMQALSILADRVGSFIFLTIAVDSGNTTAYLYGDKFELIMNDASLVESAITRYVGSVENLEEIIASSAKLQPIAFALKEMVDACKHTIAPELEPWVLQMQLSGGSAFSQLREKLDATHTVEYRGETLPLPAVRGMAYDADASVRKDAYEAEIASYKKMEMPMSYCLNAIKMEARTLAKMKGYDSVLDMTLSNSRMDRETLDAMICAMKEYLPHFRRYMKAKAKLLGHQNGLPFYDLFAPVGSASRTFTIEECREKLMAELGKFNPEMAAFVDNAFQQKWIDVYPREGKSGGAFCAGVHYADRSLVMTNFQGSFSDVSTVAHELGHAWHNRCLAGLPYALINTPMPLAETASIFNETILAHEVLKTATTEEQLTLLDATLIESTQTIVDILSRYLFETEVIDTRADHAMTVDELKACMLRAQDATYGDGLDPEIRHPYMWACKSHYYSSGLNFYNFPYAFGELFGKGVFAQYLKEGESFVPKYNQLLRSCGSGTIAEVAASVGIDVRDPAFWRASLEVVKNDIDTFCKLCEK